MAEQQPRPPLWWEMEAAYAIAEPKEGLKRAAMIRAVADWLVPRELPSVMASDHEYMARYKQRQELRQLLLAEAQRAEAGNG